MTRGSRLSSDTVCSITEEDPTSDPLLSDLTAQQREAVTHVDGPLLVLAGPGSGKTRVITRRVAYLVLRIGIPPWNVLAITFTNRAAAEMRDRTAQLLSPRQAQALNLSTFHSLGARVIRQHADRLGLPSGYSIYDAADQQRVVKQAIADLGINTNNFPPGAVLANISNAKNALLDPETFAETAGEFFSRTVARIYSQYEQILQRNKALDFDDLLTKMIRLFKTSPDTLAKLRERFIYILVDEYQDTNHAQFLIANALAAPQNHICATGDPDQSIYGWRGADISNILEFESHYPNAKIVRLEQNYRSTKQILAVADQLIRHNTQRKHKELWTENPTGEPGRLVRCQDEREEAHWVVHQFHELHKKGTAWSEMAVFYRVNSLSRVIEDAMRTQRIPYQIVRGTAFYERKEVKDAVAYLRVIVNPDDQVSLLRIINTPARGIGNVTIRALQTHAKSSQISLAQVLSEPTSVTSLSGRAVAALDSFSKLLASWRAQAVEPNGDDSDRLYLPDFVELVLRESGLEDYYSSQEGDPDEERIMNLGELVSSAHQFEPDYALEHSDEQPLALGRELELFLEQISLVSDVDALNTAEGSVTLMTLHAAKGLEFSAVAIIGIEDGLLPHQQSSAESEQIEEERRLCFVGITRAKQHLFLSHSQYRTIFGRTVPALPSRFLKELPDQHLVVTDQASDDQWLGDDDGLVADQQNEAREQAGQYVAGMLVRHPHFGLGRIINIRAAESQARARVEFQTAGVKTLVLQYARLQKVSSR